MKNFIFLLSFSVLAVTAFSQTFPSEWKLSSKQAAKMMQYYSDCSGDCPNSTATPDSAKENLIRSAFPDAKSFSWLNARYSNDDVQRYSARNAKLARNGGGNIAGYSTRILKVVDENDNVHYFDIASICPPPSICDAVNREN